MNDECRMPAVMARTAAAVTRSRRRIQRTQQEMLHFTIGTTIDQLARPQSRRCQVMNRSSFGLAKKRKRDHGLIF